MRSQPKVSFQFLIFKESSYIAFTSIHTIIFIQSHILRLQMRSTTFKILLEVVAKAKNCTDTIDSVTLGNIEANSAFVNLFVTDFPKGITRLAITRLATEPLVFKPYDGK